MFRNYNLSYKLVACTLLLNIFLQSCSNSATNFYGIEDKNELADRQMSGGKERYNSTRHIFKLQSQPQQEDQIEIHQQEDKVVDKIAEGDLRETTLSEDVIEVYQSHGDKIGWLGNIKSQKYLLSLPVAYAVASSIKPLKRAAIRPSYLGTHSKNHLLWNSNESISSSKPVILSSRSLPAAKYDKNVFSLTSLQKLNISRLLRKYPRDQGIKIGSYNSLKNIFSHLNNKLDLQTLSGLRSYTINTSSEIPSKISKKKFFLRLGVAGGILGAITYTVCSNDSDHPLHKRNLTTDLLNEVDLASKSVNTFKQPIYCENVNDLDEKDTILSDYRPNDWVHLHYAAQAYKNNGGEILKEQGWELDSLFSAKNSYFGSAYRNSKDKHIIIAHRGTQDPTDWLGDFDVITRHLNEQESNAWEFSKKIIEKYGPTYSYSFTGHSLGGWLALACLYKYKDEFINSKGGRYQDGFAVTFDDPGGEELLEALQPRVEEKFSVNINELDITSYLSRPHIINTAMGHIGSVYGLLPEINKWYWPMRKTILFTTKAHKIKLFLKSFSQNTGLPNECVTVIDWPRLQLSTPLPSSSNSKNPLGYLALALKAWTKGEINRGEYLGYHTYDLNAVNNPDQLPPASKFQLQHGIHYRVETFDQQKLPLRNMPEVLQSFLVKLSKYKDRTRIIHMLVGDTTDEEICKLLENYSINAHKEVVVDKNTTNMTARAFRDKIIRYLKQRPSLYRKKLSQSYTELLSKKIEKLEEATVTEVLSDLNNQLAYTKDLIRELSFKQGIARLYKFIKPTWEEMEEIRHEGNALNKQLIALQLANIKVQAISLESGLKAPLITMLRREEQQLRIAKQSADALLMYMEGDLTGADQQLDLLITTLNKEETSLLDLDKKVLLNRAYNLKAKIAALVGNLDLSVNYYKKALEFVGEDLITCSNYGGLLTDLGRIQEKLEEKARLYIEAYRCYEKVYPYIDQIHPEQLPIVCSGMAYGFILLAQSIEQKQIDPKQVNLPGMDEFRSLAEELLKQAIVAKPTYVNGRLFLAILHYDQKNYESALQEINNVLAIQPMHPTGLMRKGRILDKLGKSDEAIKLLEQARELLQKDDKNKGWIKEIDKIIAEIKAKK